MPQYIDQYHLVYSRSYNTAMDFLNRYLPNREQVSNEFLLPQNGHNGLRKFNNEYELMKVLEVDTSLGYSFYWSNLDTESPVCFGMLFYTVDGAILFGLSIPGRNPEESPESIGYFRDCKEFLNSELGCLTVEEPAPDNVQEFIIFCKDRFKIPL